MSGATFRRLRKFHIIQIVTINNGASSYRKNPSRASFGDIPSHWDKTQVPESGYKVGTLILHIFRSFLEFDIVKSGFIAIMSSPMVKRGLHCVFVSRGLQKNTDTFFIQIKKFYISNVCLCVCVCLFFPSELLSTAPQKNSRRLKLFS